MPTDSCPNQLCLLSLLKAEKKEKQSLDITSGINLLPRIFGLAVGSYNSRHLKQNSIGC